MSAKISIDGKAIEEDFDDQKHGTVLEFLETQDIEVHFHCRDGFCGACRVKLNQGEIHYPQGEPLAFVRPGEILTCCCIAKTDIDITLD